VAEDTKESKNFRVRIEVVEQLLESELDLSIGSIWKKPLSRCGVDG